jgi:hypothetical protein
MNIEIINTRLRFNIHGLSGSAVGKDYAGTAFRLMDKMWSIVRSQELKHKGRNIWVYEPQERVFAGVELEGAPGPIVGLEAKEVILERYAYCMHRGPYRNISKTGQAMRDEVQRKGLEVISPYVERYGHWTNDETLLETELFMAVE